MESSSQAQPVSRPYHSPARERQAAATRQRMLAAARTLFAGRGYAGTTLEAIAAAAGVSPKTVSAAFGSKRGILAALVSPDVLGARYPQLVGQLRTAQEPRRRVELAARLARQINEALSPEFELLRGADFVLGEPAEVARQVQERRRQNVARLVAYLADQGALRRDRAPDEAADEVCALTGYDLYRALVVDLGWTPDRYEAWLADVLRERLLPPA